MRKPLLLLLLVTGIGTVVTAGQIVEDTRRQEALRHYRAGQELMYAERFDKAEAEFKQAIDLDPLLTLAHYGLGQSYMAQRRYASAVQAYLTGREAHRSVFMLQQSNTVQLDRRADEEIRELKDTVRGLQSGRIKSMGGVSSTVDSRVAQLESRIRDLERLRQMSTGTFQVPAELSLALGSAYYRSGQREDAEREWKAAVAVNEKLGEAHNNLAVIYLVSGRRKEAEDAVRAAERAGFQVNLQLKDDIGRLKE